MKYLIANDIAALGDIDDTDEVVMFGQNRVLNIESATDTTTTILVQGQRDPDDEDTITLKHADKSATATHKVERNLIDDAVAAINSDGKLGFTVLFDALNNVKLPNQILTGSTVTED